MVKCLFFYGSFPFNTHLRSYRPIQKSGVGFPFPLLVLGTSSLLLPFLPPLPNAISTCAAFAAKRRRLGKRHTKKCEFCFELETGLSKPSPRIPLRKKASKMPPTRQVDPLGSLCTSALAKYFHQSFKVSKSIIIRENLNNYIFFKDLTSRKNSSSVRPPIRLRLQRARHHFQSLLDCLPSALQLVLFDYVK